MHTNNLCGFCCSVCRMQYVCLQAKDDMIKDLMEEGEKLSIKQLEQENTMKKLRQQVRYIVATSHTASHTQLNTCIHCPLHRLKPWAESARALLGCRVTRRRSLKR